MRAGTDDGPAALWVNARVAIPRSELTIRATPAGGPGGQHANRSSTRVELSWNVTQSAALDEADRERIVAALARRLDGSGVVRVVSGATRSQRQNRAAAEARLSELVRRALAVRRKRVATRVPRRAVEARLAAKRRRGELKRRRAGEE